MQPNRCGAAPLARCLLAVASFAVASFAVAAPAATPPLVDGGASVSKPVHRRHVSKRPANGPRAGPRAPETSDGAEHGNASYYGHHLSGRPTASGEAYDPNALTAAHRTLPLGTQVRVVNPKNDKSVVVTVNDRGPVAKNRVIDISSAAADQLEMKKAGVTKVETQVVGKAETSKDDPMAAARPGAGPGAH